MTATNQTAQPFDLDSIEDLAQAEFELTHPTTGAGLGAFITLAGPEHPDRKRLTFAQIRKNRAELARNAARRGGQAPVADPEEDISESLDMLATITLAWRNITVGGKEVACNKAAALALYQDPKRQWLVRQVMEKMNAIDVFTKA